MFWILISISCEGDVLGNIVITYLPDIPAQQAGHSRLAETQLFTKPSASISQVFTSLQIVDGESELATPMTIPYHIPTKDA